MGEESIESPETFQELGSMVRYGKSRRHRRVWHLCEAEKAAWVGLIGGIDTVTGDRLPPLESFQVLMKGAELCAALELCSSLQGRHSVSL